MNMCAAIHEWLDDVFCYLKKKYPHRQSYKVTPEYILERYKNAELPKSNNIELSENYYWEFNRIRAKWGIYKKKIDF